MTQEDKQQKFVRLANKRVPKAIKAINLIQNLAKLGPNPKHAQQIIDAVNEAFTALTLAFAQEKQEVAKSFALKS